MAQEYRPLRVLTLAEAAVDKIDLWADGPTFRRQLILRNQIKRAALSVPSNIVEGEGRGYTQEGVRFFRIAIASAEETKMQIRRAVKCAAIEETAAKSLHEEFSLICRMLNVLIKVRIRRMDEGRGDK